ncbi:unnamed protein product [Protopolystoma xenopodis]|uniref:Uncharacterized protein n=1 Tax=Protopolystoma xenopodis TaxID=117903 RepID=A0A448X8B7_9PLAT|nr:unnamed protein product [Protopolystoma xenopodis]
MGIHSQSHSSHTLQIISHSNIPVTSSPEAQPSASEVQPDLESEGLVKRNNLICSPSSPGDDVIDSKTPELPAQPLPASRTAVGSRSPSPIRSPSSASPRTDRTAHSSRHSYSHYSQHQSQQQYHHSRDHLHSPPSHHSHYTPSNRDRIHSGYHTSSSSPSSSSIYSHHSSPRSHHLHHHPSHQHHWSSSNRSHHSPNRWHQPHLPGSRWPPGHDWRSTGRSQSGEGFYPQPRGTSSGGGGSGPTGGSGVSGGQSSDCRDRTARWEHR